MGILLQLGKLDQRKKLPLDHPTCCHPSAMPAVLPLPRQVFGQPSGWSVNQRWTVHGLHRSAERQHSRRHSRDFAVLSGTITHRSLGLA